jgi:sulfur-oxidizing protein SoxZ
MAGSIKVRTEWEGRTLVVRAFFKHPMETGRRKDEAGVTVPAHFITEVIGEIDNEQVLSAAWSTGVAKNPALAFRLVDIRKGQRLRIRWRDNQGQADIFETTIS